MNYYIFVSMSEEAINNVSKVIKEILNPNNQVRNEAVAKLEVLRQNTPFLLFCLVKILNTSNDKSEKTIAAVLIRKILDISDEMIFNPHWKNLSAEDRTQFKTLALQCLVNETDNSLISKLTEVVIQIAMNDYNMTETSLHMQVWPDLLNYISNCFALEVNGANLAKIESSIRLFEGIFSFVYDNFSEGGKLNSILEKMLIFMKSNELTLAAKAFRTVSEISFYANKKELKVMKELIYPSLELTLKCMNANKENELKMCCKAFIEMCTESTVFLFKPFFSDLFILMGKISEKKDYDDDNIRELAYEVVVNLIEYKPNLFSNDQERLKVFVEALFKYALEMDKEIEEEWATPSQLSYFDMETIYEKEVNCAITFVERLIDTLSPSVMLPILSDYVTKLVANEQDFRYKYLGIMIFKVIITHVDDMAMVSNFFNMVFTNLKNDNPKIRFACLNTLEEMADTYKPYFSEKYFPELANFLLEKFSDPVLKVQLEATEAMNTLITNTAVDVLTPYIESILNTTFQIFLKDNLSNNLRECLLNVVATLSSEVQDKLAPYAEKCFAMIWEFFVNSYKGKINKPLYGNMIECITLIGPFNQNVYYQNIPTLIDIIVDVQSSSKLGTDPIRPYIQDSLQRLVYILKENFKDLLPKVVNSVMNLVKTIPEMSLSSNPESNFKIEDLLSASNSDPNEIKVKLETNIKTTSTEEMSSAIETLNKVIDSLGELFIPYIETTNTEIFFFLAYEFNEDIRQAASDTLPTMLSIVRKYSNGDKTMLTKLAKLYTVELYKAIEKEIDNSTLCCFLENLKEIIETADGYLVKEEVNDLFKNLLKTFDIIEQRRLKLLEKKGNVENSLNNKKKGKKEADDDSDDEEERLEKELKEDIEEIEDIQGEMTDLIGKLFATHKAYSEDVINVVINNLIPKYFRSDASTFEIKMGIYLVDDIVEFLGQDSMTKDLWHQMAKALITFATNEECTLRQASLYGLGVFAKETKKDFNLYSNECLSSIFQGLGIPSDNQDEYDWGLARDNGVAALGKIIKFQSNQVDLKLLCPKWVNLLPIIEDNDEMFEQHELLCDLILNTPDLILGENLTEFPSVVKVLSRIYKSNKYSDDNINSKIKQIMSKIKGDGKLNELFNGILEREPDTKTKKKLVKLRDE